MFVLWFFLNPETEGESWLVSLINISIQVLKRFLKISMHLENYNEISVNLYCLESRRLHYWENEKNLEKKILQRFNLDLSFFLWFTNSILVFLHNTACTVWFCLSHECFRSKRGDGEAPLAPLVCRVVELLTGKKQSKYGSKKAIYSFTEVQLMVILVD